MQHLHAQANSFGLSNLTKVPNINLESYFDKLTQLQRRSNHLQELMIVKAFSSSIEVSKALGFMAKLVEIKEESIRKVSKFAEQ